MAIKEIEMKKIILASILFTLLLALVACGGTSNSGSTTSNSTSLTLEEELLVGTFKLESTDLGVSSDQASQLLPLWETLQSLAKSGTAASEEIDAVVSQIEGTMSQQQLDAITAMELTQRDLESELTALGVSASNSNANSSSSTTSVQGLANAGPTGGGSDSAGGNPGGGGNPPSDMTGGDPSGAVTGQQLDQVQASTAQTSSSQATGTSSQISSALISALVELLQKKAG
jgi:hypothetical protein